MRGSKPHLFPPSHSPSPTRWFCKEHTNQHNCLKVMVINHEMNSQQQNSPQASKHFSFIIFLSLRTPWGQAPAPSTEPDTHNYFLHELMRKRGKFSGCRSTCGDRNEVNSSQAHLCPWRSALAQQVTFLGLNFFTCEWGFLRSSGFLWSVIFCDSGSIFLLYATFMLLKI